MTKVGFYLDDHFESATVKSWRRIPMKAILREVDERSATGNEELLGLSGRRGVLKRSEMEQRASEAATYIGYKKVQPNQLISNKMQAWNGMFGVSPFEGITSPDYAVYEFADKSNARLIEYSLRAKLFAAEFHCRSKGMGTGFLRLNPKEFLSTPFWLPNSETTTAIADFLDRETARIDQLIEKKQRLVELVDEKRSALITAAVTGRIDSETGRCRSPNGVAGVNSFVNSTPVGWSRCRLKFLLDGCKNGAWGSEAGEDELDAICVRVADFVWGKLSVSLRNPTIRSFPKLQVNKLALAPGDLLLEKSGGGEKTPVGRIVAFDSEELSVSSNFVARIRPNSKVYSRFLLYLIVAQYMTGYSFQFIKQNTGIQNLDDDAWFSSDVWLPHFARQTAIADFLDHETARIDSLKAKTTAAIDRLHELRAALITAVVTGQIDVAAWSGRGQVDRSVDEIEAATQP